MNEGGNQTDTAITGLTGGAQGASGAAYTNSWPGTEQTTLYILDAADDQLCFSSNPNGGTATGCKKVKVGDQNFDVPTASEIDFAADVRVGTANAEATGTLHAVFTVSGAGHLYSIDLANGAATDRGQIGGAATEIIGLAVGHASVK
jgi:outer membrane protein assembly factor BamB